MNQNAQERRQPKHRGTVGEDDLSMVGRTIGRYEIVEEIGRGGMAVVYKAFQPNLKRYVALKVLPPQFTFDTVFVTRFHQEAAAAAKLDHSNIVTIHDVDEVDGTHYIVMQYLEGRPLSQVIREEGPLSPRRAVYIVRQLAKAADYAHAEGFVHRDIKPSNVIIGPRDHATLTDFGIVKAAEGTSLTRTGALVGTPEYMSPEQVRGLEVDHRSDVYSLGVVAYEMLAGRAPFQGETATVLHSHVYEPPPPLGQVNPRVPGRMESALERALAKKPEQRYQTAGEMARALAGSLVAAGEGAEAPRVISGEPETVMLSDGGPPTGTEEARQVRQKEAAARYRQAVRSLADRKYESALDSLHEAQALDPGYADPQGVERAARRGLADRATTSSAGRLGVVPCGAVAVLVLLVVAVIGGGLLVTVLRRLPVTSPLGPVATPISTVAPSPYIGPVPDGARARLGKGLISEIALSPRGDLLAVASSIGIYLYRVDTLGQVACFGTDDWVYSLAFSPDGQTLASGSSDDTVILWDVESRDPQLTLEGHTDYVTSISFSPDGRTLASGSADDTVLLWDLESGDLQHALEGHTEWVTSVSFSPDGRTLASGSGDRTVLLWDVEGGALLRTLEGHTEGVASVDFSPDGRALASGSWDDTVLLWDVESGDPQGALESHRDSVRSVAFSPDGRTLASASLDNTLILWDVESGKPQHTLGGHTGWVRSVSFSPDGRAVASGSCDGTVIFWDVESGDRLGTLEGYTDWVRSISFSPDGRTLASGSGDNTVILWNVESGDTVRILEGHTADVTSVSFSPDGRAVASGSWDGTVVLWDVQSGDPLRTLEGHTGWVNSVSFSPDGRAVASGSDDGTVILWEVETGGPLRTLKGHTECILSISFSPDGRILASGSGDHMVILWDAESGDALRTLRGHTDWVRSVAFSPDGRTVGSGSDDGTVILWDVESGDPLRTLEGHTGWVDSVSFSPDGRAVASGSDDGTVILWDVETGNPLRTVEGQTSGVTSVAFSSDGRTLASGSWDGTVLLTEVE
jgi:WD40 repeat protein